MLEEGEREILREVAWAAAKRAMGLPSPVTPQIAAESALHRPTAAFVTWKKDGRPRGRSGTTAPSADLVRLVERLAIEALLHDPRVPPATARELSRHEPEISVLSTLEEIFGAEGLLPGTHGVFVEKGKRRGIVLPQDGHGLDWDASRMLSQACLRAGLPEESWKAGNPPRLLRFTAEVF
jgi:uncharacterized protein